MDGLTNLETELGSAVPAGFSRLSGEQLDDLASAVREARRRQAREIDAAAERALGFVPRLLRGPIRKIVG